MPVSVDPEGSRTTPAPEYSGTTPSFSRMPIIIGTTRDDGWTFVNRSFPAEIDGLQYDRAVRTEFGMDADAVLALYPATAFATPKDALARLTTDVEFVCDFYGMVGEVWFDEGSFRLKREGGRGEGRALS